MSVPVVRVVDVGKKFRLNKNKSLKERIVHAGRNRDYTEEFWALQDVTFDIEAGDTLGLIGPNGSGKSTLLKLIGGILTPTTGYVERRGRLAALLELGAGFHPDLTGRENVYLNASILGLSKKQTTAYFDAIVDFSEIGAFIDQQVKFYSSGMYVRLAFAVAVHVDPELLLVDEVLAVGDEPFQRKCLERIKQFQREGRTIVLVTHGLDQARQLCERVIMLDHGKVMIDGSPIEAIRAFRDMHGIEAAARAAEGTGEVDIVKVQLTDRDGQPRDSFAPGDDLAVEVDVVANEPVEQWACGIALMNQVETLVFGTNSEIMGVSLGRLKDRARLRFVFENIPITEGQYFVTVAVHPPGAAYEYHRVERAANFRVLSPAGEMGVVHLAPRLELLDT